MTPAALLEREREIAACAQAVQVAMRGQGTVVVVSGDTGSGKTALVQAVLAQLPNDARVLIGWCDDVRQPLPLGPWRDVGRQLGGSAGRALVGGDPDGLLDSIAKHEAVTVLVIEDVHHACSDSLDLLLSISRRIGSQRCLLLLTFRQAMANGACRLVSLLGSLVARRCTRMHLPLLSAATVRRLAAQHGLDGSRLFELTGGNPWYLNQLLQTGDLQVTAAIREYVLAQLCRLPPAVVCELLEPLAVAEPGVSIAAAELAIPHLGSYLSDAEAAGLLVLSDRTIRFRHDVVRLAIRSHLTANQVRKHHQLWITKLSQASAPSTLIFGHAVAAGDGKMVAAHGPGAARQALVAGDYAIGRERYDATLALADRLPDRLAGQLHAEYALELSEAARSKEAIDHAFRAAARAQPAADELTRFEALVVACRAQLDVGDHAAARLTAREAKQVTIDPDDPTICGPAATLVECLSELGEHCAAIEVRERIDLVVPALPALAVAAQLAAIQPEPVAAVKELLKIRDRAAAQRDHRVTSKVALSLLRRSGLAGLNYPYPSDMVPNALDAATASASERCRFGLQVEQAIAWSRAGKWALAESSLCELLRSSAMPFPLHELATAVLGHLLVRKGSARGKKMLDRVWEMTPAGRLRARAWAGAGLLEAAWLGDDRINGAELGIAALEAALLCGDYQIAGQTLRYQQRMGLKVSLFDQCPIAWRHGVEGDWRRAAAAWLAAATPYERALELVESGDVESVLEGREILDQLGAAPAGRHALHRLQRLGVHTRRRAEQPLGLTRRQAEVLELISAGMTNSEIAHKLVVSIRTVDHHVAAILAKFGVPNRREAARLWWRSGWALANSSEWLTSRVKKLREVE